MAHMVMERSTRTSSPEDLAEVIAALRARYGEHIIRVASATRAFSSGESPTLSTSSLSLDLLTGGLPRGQITEITGPDGAGKGTLAATALAACQRDGGLVLLVDAEHTADPDALAAAGVDVEHLIVACPGSAAAAWDVVRMLSRCGALDLIVTSLSGILALPGAGWGPGYLERRLIRLRAALRGRRTALVLLNQPLPLHWSNGGGEDQNRNMALDGQRPWSLDTVGGSPVAQAVALRIALRPASVHLTPDGAIAWVRSHAWVVKHHGSPRGPLMLLEIGPGGIRRAAELVLLAEACGCVRHTSLGLFAVGTILGRTADRAARALEADAALASTLEAEVRAAWSAAPFVPTPLAGAPP